MAGGVEPVPGGVPTVATRLVFDDATAAIAFYQEAFGASVREEPYKAPDGKVVHSEVWIGDSVVFLTDEGDGEGEDRNGVAPSSVGSLVTAVMALSVPDVDALWERAVAAGCEVVYPLADQFYGDRAGRLRDPFGHQWMLSTHIEDVDRDEIDRRMQAWSEQQG
jgi:PhnB protein